MLRSLHRHAISSGFAGVLGRSPDEQAVFVWITRRGSATRAQLEALADRVDVDLALAGLLADGTLTVTTDGEQPTFRLAGSRRSKVRTPGLLDKL